MINVLYEEYPSSVVIDNISYPIVTDFRNWIAFFDMINDTELKPKDIVIASLRWYAEKIPSDINMAYQGLVSFANAEEIQYKNNVIGISKSNKQILSYLCDSPYILGAFLQTYGINLRNIEYMHWYEFRALLTALPEDVPIKKRMSYRAINLVDIKDKAERKRIKAIQRDIALPHRELSAFDIGNQF